MKHTFLLFCLLLAGRLTAQDNPITAINITLPTNPDANTANWGTGASAFTITVTTRSINGRIDPSVGESRILVIIKKDGRQVGGTYTASSAPAANFTAPTKVWSGSNAAALLGKGTLLPPGDYELDVILITTKSAQQPAPVSAEKIKSFTIRGNDQQASRTAPGGNPVSGAGAARSDPKQSTAFGWTPVAPPPGSANGAATNVNAAGQAAVPPAVTQNPGYTTQVAVTAGNFRPAPVVGNGMQPRKAAPTETFAAPVGTPIANFQPPQVLSPADGSALSGMEVKQPISFRWTPVVPTPQGPVTYRLQVFEILPGQDAAQAIKANQPIITKDVDNLTQAIIPNLATGPGLPPSRRDYVWTVQALDRDAKPLGGNTGLGMPAKFSESWSEGKNGVSTTLAGGGMGPTVNYQPPKTLSPANGAAINESDARKPITFRWTPLVPKPQEPVTYRLQVWEILPGQDAAQAFRGNRPLLDEQVDNLTQAARSLEPATGSPQAFTAHDYVWSVQALNREGQPLGRNEGRSETAYFAVEK